MRFNQHLSYRKQLTPIELIKMVLDPFIIIGMLFIISWLIDEEIGREHILLSLFIFALTFPGTWAKGASILAEFKYIFSTWPFFVGILLFFGYATGYLSEFSSDLVIGWVTATPFVMWFAHYVIRRILYHFRTSSSSLKHAVVVGASDLGCQLRDRIKNEPMLGIEFRGFFDDRNEARLAIELNDREQLLGKVQDLAAYLKQYPVELIYIALPMGMQPRIMQLLDDLKDTTASIYFVPDVFMFDMIQARLDDVAGLPVVAVCETPFSGMNGLIKRWSDVVLSTLILLLISPLLVLLAVGVKLTSPGPVLFKQRRYGLDGKEIVVYKFRSMTVCEDGEKIVQATRNDRRITRLGAFMRKTSLDELPQFVNVIQGRMSIVGPRPHAVAHNETYRKLIKGYMIRHKVKPGITGWAQVNGLRGETETVEKMEARIQYDLEYLRRWSLWFDLLIIVRTVQLVFKDSKAF